MLDPQAFEAFGQKLRELLASSPAQEIEKNTKAALGDLFGRMNLVTREEFDIQAQVLARTREKLKALEARVEALERARQGQ